MNQAHFSPEGTSRTYSRDTTGNRSALARLDEEILSDLSTYPAEEVLTKLEAGLPLDMEW